MRHAGILLLILLLPTASAHAVLQTAEPPPNGRAAEGVERITIRFTEDVEREYTDADVLDLQGESWKAGPIEFDREHRNVVHVPVRPLVSGLYSASWKALSVDTHTTRGSFIFAVGNATLQPGGYAPIVDVASDADVAREGFPRFAFFLGLFLAGGMPLFALAVLRAPPSRALFLTAAAFGAVGAAGALVSMLFLGERIGGGFAQALGTTPGRSFATRGLLVAGAAAASTWAALAPRTWRPAAIAAVALAAAGCVATSFGSHAAAVRDATALYIAADAAHLLAALVWVGGIAGFLHVLAGRGPVETSHVVFRFGALAVPSVAVLLGTGTLASMAHMHCFEEGARACLASLREDRYAQLVALKLALMAPLVALGALNKFMVGPRLARGAWSPERFRRIVAAEAALMLVIVGAAGGLAASSPPAATPIQTGPAVPDVLEMDNLTAKSHVILQVSPNPVTVGIQRFVVIVHPLGPTLPNGTIVQLKVWKEGERQPDVNIDLEQVTPNEWETEGGLLTSAGTWNVMVLLQRPDEFARIPFQVEVVNPGEQPTSS